MLTTTSLSVFAVLASCHSQNLSLQFVAEVLAARNTESPWRPPGRCGLPHLVHAAFCRAGSI
jgi:hypothetical protein